MVKLLVIDVDGTLTDGVVYIGNTGELCKGFYVRDGLGIMRAIKNGVKPIILTSRESGIVTVRAGELGIEEVYLHVPDKREFLERYLKDNGYGSEDIAYMADDINDYEAIQLAGLRGCPSDAVPEMKNICNFVSRFEGGRGAVREFCDFIVDSCVRTL